MATINPIFAAKVPLLSNFEPPSPDAPIDAFKAHEQRLEATKALFAKLDSQWKSDARVAKELKLYTDPKTGRKRLKVLEPKRHSLDTTIDALTKPLHKGKRNRANTFS